MFIFWPKPQALEICHAYGIRGDKQQTRFSAALFEQISQFIHISSACGLS